jgi:tubulin-specific chaperone A
MYRQEETDQLKHIDKLQKEGADSYNIKKQYEVLQETKNMIPERTARLETSVQELEALLVS